MNAAAKKEREAAEGKTDDESTPDDGLSEVDRKLLEMKKMDQKMGMLILHPWMCVTVYEEEERQARNEAKIQAENEEKLKRFEEQQKSLRESKQQEQLMG